MTRGKVPHFSMRPSPGLLISFLLVLLTGFLLAMAMFERDEGAGDYHARGVFILMITGIICFCLLVLMTSKLWFPHLWKKNSTHARHKQHSRYHPTNRASHPRENSRKR